MQTGSTNSSVAQAVVAALIGLIALPAIFDTGSGAFAAGGASLSLTAVAWLVGGLAVSVWLLAMVPGLARGLSGLLGRLELQTDGVATQRSAMRVGAEVVSRWIVGVAEVVVIQAILRRPVVGVLGTLVDPSTVDAAFAAGTLVLLLIVLIWLHRSARPLVEAATWQALDALVATSGSERAQALAGAADTEMATAAAGTRGRGGVGTRSRADAGMGDEATRPAGAAEATIAASTADVTRLAPGEATVADVDDATRLAPGGATVERADDLTRPGPPIDDPSGATLPGEPGESTVADVRTSQPENSS